MIRIGCSGYYYDDWTSFYGREKRDRLNYYASVFSTLEINSTFYAVPPRKNVTGWTKKTAAVEDFRYTLKLPKDISHRLVQLTEDEISLKVKEFTSKCMEPIREAGQLGGVLVQLPPWADSGWIKKAGYLLQEISANGSTSFLEARSSSLDNSDELRRMVQDAGSNMVSVDSPVSEFKRPDNPGRIAYVRLHGRNYSLWDQKNVGLSRYSYDYSEKELITISQNIMREKDSFGDIYIFFNNHPGGGAPKNAISMMELMHASRPKSSQSQLF